MKIVMPILLFIGIILLMGLLMGLPIMLLWNALLPELFGFKEISFLQAWGLMILSGLLFKSAPSSSKKD
jgi:hypothetical protein